MSILRINGDSTTNQQQCDHGTAGGQSVTHFNLTSHSHTWTHKSHMLHKPHTQMSYAVLRSGEHYTNITHSHRTVTDHHT